MKNIIIMHRLKSSPFLHSPATPSISGSANDVPSGGSGGIGQVLSLTYFFLSFICLKGWWSLAGEGRYLFLPFQQLPCLRLALTCMLQICRFFSPSFGGRMASAFSLIKSRSLYLVIGPMWQKFILLTIPHYSKIDWPMTLFCPRSPPFMSSNGIFLQAKWSKIKERVEGWKSGKKMWFKRITVWNVMWTVPERCLNSPPSVIMILFLSSVVGKCM